MSQPQAPIRTLYTPKQQTRPEIPAVRVLATAQPRSYFDPWYLPTFAGGLRMVQIISTFIAFVCSLMVNQAFMGTYITFLSTMFCFICSLILIIFYLFNLVQLVPINWIFYELIYSGLAAFLLIAAALTMIYSSVRWMYAVWIAAAIAHSDDAYEQDFNMWLDTLVILRDSWYGLTGHFRDRRVLDNVENDDENIDKCTETLSEVDINEDEEEDEKFEGEFADKNADDNSSSNSEMRDYRRQLKADPNFVQTLRNMTRIYSSIRHQKLEAMGSSTDPQQLLLTDEIANIERDLSEMNDMINQHENE